MSNDQKSLLCGVLARLRSAVEELTKYIDESTSEFSTTAPPLLWQYDIADGFVYGWTTEVFFNPEKQSGSVLEYQIALTTQGMFTVDRSSRKLFPIHFQDGYVGNFVFPEDFNTLQEAKDWCQQNESLRRQSVNAKKATKEKTDDN